MTLTAEERDGTGGQTGAESSGGQTRADGTGGQTGRFAQAHVATDLRGVFVKVDGTFEVWTGYARTDLVGKLRLIDVLTGTGRMQHESRFVPLLFTHDSVVETMLELRRRDGSMLPVLANAVLLRTASGEPRAIKMNLLDATDEILHEQELASLHRLEHDIADQLQRSMLTSSLPTGPGFALQVVYAPAEDGLEVGGDWYDAFWIDEETLGLVVGDVVGHGIKAAATMGQLKTAVRTLSAAGLGPAELLTAMDEFSRRYEIGQATTFVYAQLRLRDRLLRFACAGHLPPAILGAAGEPRLLWDARSAPLGVVVEGHRREASTFELGPGTTLLLYTDGLIETRNRPLNEGLDLLLQEMETHGDEPVATFVPALAAALGRTAQLDDVCVMGLQLSQERGTVSRADR